MKKVLLIVIVLAIAGVFVLAAMQPPTFTIQRSISIKAKADRIFPYINDFHKWTAWSPYESKDPAMNKTYAGAESGKGSIYNWSGNNKVGEGQMDIEESSPEKIVVQLVFSKPMRAKNTVEFTLVQGKDDITEVTWAMKGINTYKAKLFHVFMNMDKMMGPDFESGLSKLKETVEKQAPAAPVKTVKTKMKK